QSVSGHSRFFGSTSFITCFYFTIPCALKKDKAPPSGTLSSDWAAPRGGFFCAAGCKILS
ncbi:MAG: hypothetical protein PHG73_13170, partial [Pygmaiobacter sp.]|nr:hypothetical protein [Pygmaiobacter sp.]